MLLERPVHLLREIGSREPVESSEHLEVLARCEHRINRDLLRHDPEFRRRVAAVEDPIEHPDLAAVEAHPAGDRPDQGRLAGAIRTEQGKQLSLPELERRTIQCLDRAECLARVAYRQERSSSARSPRARRRTARGRGPRPVCRQ